MARLTDPRPSLFRRLWLQLLAVIGVGAAVLFGLWSSVEDARQPDVVPRTALGQPVDLGRTRLTPVALEWRPATGDAPARLALRAVAENVTGTTQDTPFGLPPRPPEMSLKGTTLPQPEITLDRDDSPLRQLPPRMPEPITLVWTLPPGAAADDPATIRFDRQRFKLRDNFYGRAAWLGFVPEAVLTLAPSTRPATVAPRGRAP